LVGDLDETRTDTAEPCGIVQSTTTGAVALGASHATEIFSPSGPTAITDAEVSVPSVEYSSEWKRAFDTGTHFDGSPSSVQPFGSTGATAYSWKSHLLQALKGMVGAALSRTSARYQQSFTGALHEVGIGRQAGGRQAEVGVKVYHVRDGIGCVRFIVHVALRGTESHV
jgi:hypothetical protein